MTRPWIVILLLLCVSAARAWATEQVEERIIVGGRVFRMSTTPLEPLLDARGDRPFERELLSTNLWRGYVGTWLLEADGLYLVSLTRYAYEGETHRRVEKDIPLSLLFGDRAAPIPATWWSGQLVVPQGNLLRAAVRSRHRLHEKSHYLVLKDGRVVSKRLVDNRAEGRGLSADDCLWTLRAQSPSEDDGDWLDARSLGSEAFWKAVPSETTFRTRGVLSIGTSGDATLWIPATPATDTARIELRDLPQAQRLVGMPHVELTATWKREGKDAVLSVLSVRRLEHGETMHHPDFVVPALPASTLPGAGTELAVGAGSDVRSAADVPHYTGSLVALRGVLADGTAAMLQGVEVAGDEALDEKDVVAAGLLEKWIVSPRLLQTDPIVERLFRTRGPGTYYRLVHPTTGELARPRRPD